MVKLTASEITKAQILIDKKIPGVYELMYIYGNKWDSIPSPTDFGMRFKGSVENGMLNNIVLDMKKSNNHQTYKIR